MFSGAAIEGPGGRPLLFYTSIGKRDPEQWLATPKDDELLTWEKYQGNPVLSLKHHGATKVHEWRDPFLFREAGRTFLVAGGNLDPRGAQAAARVGEKYATDMVVSGKVTFSDGKRVGWILDQTGRLGLTERGYRPPAADLQEFQAALDQELSKMGF